jgi:hypothetical protein
MGMRFLTPPRSSTWPRQSMPATGRWYSSAPSAACGSGSWPGSAQAGSICRPGRSPWPRSSRGQRQADRRPAQDARRRTVGLPPFVVREPAANLAASQRPSSHVLPPRWGAAAGPGLSGALLGAGYQGSRPAGPAHPRPSPHRRGAVDRRRRDAQGGRRARGHTSVSFTLTATATRRSPGRSRTAGAIQ